MKRFGTYFALALTLILASCGSDDAPVSETEIYEVRRIGTLSTTEYTVSKIVKLDDKGEWYKWGHRRILLSCKARIKAGVNLSKIKDKDINVRGKRIEIQLPPPEIISFEMNPDEVKTEMQDISGLRADFSQSEKNRIMRLGEKSIRKDLQELNILRDAETNAIAFLTDFYKELGFEEIIIHGTEKTQRN
jgi:hypothetical protein